VFVKNGGRKGKKKKGSGRSSVHKTRKKKKKDFVPSRAQEKWWGRGEKKKKSHLTSGRERKGRKSLRSSAATGLKNTTRGGEPGQEKKSDFQQKKAGRPVSKKGLTVVTLEKWLREEEKEGN